MTDFSVKISVRNARFLRAMRAAGYESQTALCRASGVPMNAVNGLMCFRMSPISHGDWTSYAMSISSALHVEPEELWPEHMRHLRMDKNSREVVLSLEEVRQLAAPRTMEIDKASLTRLLGKLTPREQAVIAARYGLGDVPEMTLREAGASFGVSPERMRQIEQKALRKLKFECKKIEMTAEEIRH